jgi:hypothetical protein
MWRHTDRYFPISEWVRWYSLKSKETFQLIDKYIYNNVSCYRDAALLLTLGEGFSVFGGFVVFSVLGFMAHTNGVGVEEIAKSGKLCSHIIFYHTLVLLEQ